jgi:hypothetical protein
VPARPPGRVRAGRPRPVGGGPGHAAGLDGLAHGGDARARVGLQAVGAQVAAADEIGLGDAQAAAIAAIWERRSRERCRFSIIEMTGWDWSHRSASCSWVMRRQRRRAHSRARMVSWCASWRPGDQSAAISVPAVRALDSSAMALRLAQAAMSDWIAR